MSRNIKKLESLLEARRVLRKLKVSYNNNVAEITALETLVTKKTFNKSRQKERMIAEIRERSSRILKESCHNRKLSEHVSVMLSTHLKTRAKLGTKLTTQAQLLALNNMEISTRSANLLTELPVKPEEKEISSIVQAIARRFNTEKFEVISSMATPKYVGDVGVITIKNKTTDQKMHCAIWDKEGEHQLKTFIGELIALDIMPANFVSFKSPVQAFNMVSDIMKQDHFN